MQLATLPLARCARGELPSACQALPNVDNRDQIEDTGVAVEAAVSPVAQTRVRFARRTFVHQAPIARDLKMSIHVYIHAYIHAYIHVYTHGLKIQAYMHTRDAILHTAGADALTRLGRMAVQNPIGKHTHTTQRMRTVTTALSAAINT